jgi:hypothetical protein
MGMTKTGMMLTCCLAVAGAVALGAQSSETTTKTTIEVENGKDLKVTGCVDAGAAGGYVLTEVASKGQPMHTYTLVSDNEDFSKLVGHRVQIEGKVGDRGNGKVEIKTETKVDGPGKDTKTKTEGSGAYLSVKHMKTIAGSCK